MMNYLEWDSMNMVNFNFPFKIRFNYLLTLRLIPIFPFWLVNIVPAILGVRLKTYVLATALGIIPGRIVFVAMGSGLETIFAKNQSLNLFQHVGQDLVLCFEYLHCRQRRLRHS